MRGAAKPFPVILVFLAIVFNIANGYAHGRELFFAGTGKTAAWFYDPRFVCGTTLFAAGFAVHITSDRILRSLRGPKDVGEILQWVGWAVATWSIAGLAFALFTIANLLPRGISHHRWYQATFVDYPRQRRAVIPFIL